MSYEIFAHHAHVFPKNTREDGDIDSLKRLLDECGISGAVCFAAFPYQFRKYDLTGERNECLFNDIKGDSNLVGFGTIDFDADNIEDQVKHIASLGFKGIKIHPAAQEINVMGEKAQRVYATAEELGLFLSFHTGLHWHRIKDYNILLFDEVAWNFPKLRFSMEHMGGYSFFREALLVMNNNSRSGEHVYGGWTSINMNKNGLPDYWSLSDEELRTLIHQNGYEKSIFGLDFPYKKAPYINSSIERIMNLDIPEEAKPAILGNNLKRVLGI